MNNYYITFGSEGQTFKGGWIIIEAETIEQACKIFRAMYQYKETNDTLLKFCSIYTEEGFKQTENVQKQRQSRSRLPLQSKYKKETV